MNLEFVGVGPELNRPCDYHKWRRLQNLVQTFDATCTSLHPALLDMSRDPVTQDNVCLGAYKRAFVDANEPTSQHGIWCQNELENMRLQSNVDSI